jgi:hypothetical protein
VAARTDAAARHSYASLRGGAGRVAGKELKMSVIGMACGNGFRVAMALACAGFWGCIQDGGKGAASIGAGAGLRLSLAPAALLKSQAEPVPEIDSLRIRITGEDMAPIEFARGGDSLTVDLEGLPAGDDRLVSAWLFRQGKVLYIGKGQFPFRREARLEASLRCDPQFSRVVSRFHLPVGLPTPIRGGRLTLKGTAGEYSADLEVQDEFGSFRVDEVPGDVRYMVSMTLTDSAGRRLYGAERADVLLPLGEEANWDLTLLPTEASAGLSLGLAAPKQALVRTGFPATRRAPLHAGEIVVSGFYAAPAEKDSGSLGEWFSIFNRSADTLSLSGCRLGRDRGAGATRSYAFPAETYLSPGGSLVFGRPAARADYAYTDFSLVNTASSLLLLCAGDSLMLDSLRYSSVAADSASALPMKDGWITRLSAMAVSQRAKPEAWCLARPEAGPPGELADCTP